MPTPEEWLEIKQAYNSAGPLKKKMMELKQAWRICGGTRTYNIFHILERFKAIKQNYIESRGMDFWTDVRDWLGGWPMEFVKEDDCVVFCQKKLGLEALLVNTGEGNTEFVFRPEGARNYWTPIMAMYQTVDVSGPFSLHNGNMYELELPAEVQNCVYDSNEGSTASKLILMEDGVSLSVPHSMHLGIVHLGEGRYSHWNGRMFFSTSDNSDPNSNQRRYSIRYPRDKSLS